MARRFAFVAIAALAAVLLPASAWAATPSLTSAKWASPVTLSWNSTALASETLFRAAGACPATSGTQVQSEATTPGQAQTASNAPGDGTFCYFIQDDPDAIVPGPIGDGLTVQVDTTAPTGTVSVSPENGTLVRGTVTIAGTSSDSGSGVDSSVLHHGAVGNCAAGTSGASWNTTGSADGSYDICNVVTDNAGHTFTATSTVVVDNTSPTGDVTAPASGSYVEGTIPLTIDDNDDGGIASVQWVWAGSNGTQHTITTVTGIDAESGGNTTWNTAAGSGHGDGPAQVWAIITDEAGNPTTATDKVSITVDNTKPNGTPVLSAPPAVAGSPTLSWTPGSDAIGLDHYDIKRGSTVVGTVSAEGDPSYSFTDDDAPDQVTSTYTVVAYDHAGNFVTSNAVSVFVDSNAVSAPRALTAKTPTAAAPVLTWQAPASYSVAHYDIYRDGVLVGSTTGTQTTYTDTTAPEGVHDYAVLARGTGSGNPPGVLSDSFKVILDKTPPVSGGAPTVQVLASGLVHLSWPAAMDALSGVPEYIVRRATGGTPPTSPTGGVEACSQEAPDCSDTPAAGTWSYAFFAVDGAGNVALIGTVADVPVIDKAAPKKPTKLSVTRTRSKQTKTTSTKVSFTLHWVKPTAPDLARVVVVLNLSHPPSKPTDGRVIYKGLASSAKIELSAGQIGYVALYAYDHSGNHSSAARRVVSLASLLPLRPVTGSTVKTDTPMLTWKAQKGSLYYNVQLFRNGKRVLVGWPTGAAFRIPAGKLKAGNYVWFVWPAMKHGTGAPTFGQLLGRAIFRYQP